MHIFLIKEDRTDLVIVRLGISTHEEPRRVHPRQAHPASVIAQVRHLIETTRLPHRDIAYRAGVDKGTVSRWAARHGWVLPVGACRPAPREATRYVPNVIGRALATRLRIQAERLVGTIEAAPHVDPAALAEALRLLAEARAEQAVRRSRKLAPPSLERVAALRAAKAQEEEEAREHARYEIGHFRRTRQPPLPLRSSQPSDAEPAYVWRWDRAESARQGWKRRYERMRTQDSGKLKVTR